MPKPGFAQQIISGGGKGGDGLGNFADGGGGGGGFGLGGVGGPFGRNGLNGTEGVGGTPGVGGVVVLPGGSVASSGVVNTSHSGGSPPAGDVGGGGTGLVVSSGIDVTTEGANLWGGNGGSASSPFSGGGGGGVGALVDADSRLTVDGHSVIEGGRGGRSGSNGGGWAGDGGAGLFLYNNNQLNLLSGTITGGGGGYGSNGGAGVLVNSGTVTNKAVIGGGAGIGNVHVGGFGGAGVEAYQSNIWNMSGGEIRGGASAMQGGAGVVLLVGSPSSLLNEGTIIGGSSSVGGGLGGAGVVVRGTGHRVINAGTISAGTSTATQNSVELRGTDNTLELWDGYAFTSRVVSWGDNVLAFGGLSNATFDLAGLSDGKFQGFTGLEKLGASTWTLTGTQSGARPFTIKEGTIIATNDGALGGGVTFEGGTLVADYTGTLPQANFAQGSTATIAATTGNTLVIAGDVGLNAWAPQHSLHFGGDGLDGTVALAPTTFNFATTDRRVNIDGGTLRLDNDAAGHVLHLSPITVAAGATLDVTNLSDTVIRRLFGGGTIKTANGMLYVAEGEFSGGIEGAASVSVPQYWSKAPLILSGTGLNTYTGDTLVEPDRVLKAGAINALSASSFTRIAGTLDLGGYDQGIRMLSGSGLLTNSGTGAAALTITGMNTPATSFDGRIEDGAGRTALILDGPNVAMALNGVNGYTGGTTVNAGRLTASRSGAFVSNTAYTINGGALDLGNFDLTMSSLSGTGGALVAGSADLTLDQAANTLFDGRLEGSGSLSKTGTGSLLLRGDSSSSFTGSTTVDNGSLLVGDAAGGKLGGRVTVGANGTLGGSGTLTGNVTVDGTLAAGNSPGTLTFAGDLTLNGGSRSVFELNTPGIVGGSGVASNDLVSVAGNLTLGGVLQAGVAAAGYYRLFNYGSLSGGFATESIASTNGNFAVASHELLFDTPNQINLLVVGSGQAIQFWDGAQTSPGSGQGGAGTWNSGNTNWANLDDTVNRSWMGSVGVFGGTSGTVSVTGTQSFDTLQFSTDGYVLSGGALSFNPANAAAATLQVDTGVTARIGSVLSDGATAKSLAKSGGGTLVLSGANTYTGDTSLLGGTLSIAADNNLGAAGNVVFDGGRLATTASFASSRSLTLAQTAGIDVAGSTTLGLTGSLSGRGDLVKQGAGTLELTGRNAYGNTLVEAGVLRGNVSSISGAIGNAGTVVFDQAASATFSGNISGLSGTQGKMVKRGAGQLTLGVTSTLDWTVEAGGLTTAADRFGGNVSIAHGASVSFDQSADGVYQGDLSGDGRFEKAGAGALVLKGNGAGFTGTVAVSGGTIVIGQGGSGSLGGSLDIRSGATLGGTGTIGQAGATVNVASGAVHAPGNSIGKQKIAGHYVNHGTLQIEATPNSADQIIAAGNVDISGATLQLLLSPEAASGWNVSNGPYTIIDKQSAGAIVGTFGEVKSSLLFLTSTLDYLGGDGNDVTLKLSRNDIRFATVGRTPNQISAAAAIDRLPMTSAVWNALALTTDQQAARAAYDGLSGEIHASAKAALIEDSRFVRNALNERLRVVFDGVGAEAQPLASSETAGAWSTAFGAWGSIDGDGNAAGLDRSTGGVLMGIDGSVSDLWSVGIMGGYSQSSGDADARRSSYTSDNYHVGLYAGSEWGAMTLRSGLAYTWSDVETDRAVGFNGFSDALSARYRAGTTQVFGEVGYGMKAGMVALEPFANLANVGLHSRGFEEKGGAAVLSAAGGSTNVSFATLGLRASTQIELGQVKATARGMVGWQHAFGDTATRADLAFAGAPAFAVFGTPIARDAAVVEVGLDFEISPDALLGLSYQGAFASSARDDGFKANLRVAF